GSVRAESAPALPLLSPFGRLADRFVQQLSGWQAAQDAQVLPVPTHRPFAGHLAGHLDSPRTGAAPATSATPGAAAPLAGAALARRVDGRGAILPEEALATVSAPALTLLTPEGPAAPRPA